MPERGRGESALGSIAERIRRDNAGYDAAVRDRRVLALAEARRLACIGIAESSPFKVDVVELAQPREGVAERVRAEGVPLYEKVEQVAWHRELIRRMTLDIAGLRPALLDEEGARLVDEPRAFRHLFRHLYARSIDPERVEFVQRRVEPALRSFRRCHAAFVEQLLAIKALVARERP